MRASQYIVGCAKAIVPFGNTEEKTAALLAGVFGVLEALCEKNGIEFTDDGEIVLKGQKKKAKKKTAKKTTKKKR